MPRACARCAAGRDRGGRLSTIDTPRCVLSTDPRLPRSCWTSTALGGRARGLWRMKGGWRADPACCAKLNNDRIAVEPGRGKQLLWGSGPQCVLQRSPGCTTAVPRVYNSGPQGVLQRSPGCTTAVPRVYYSGPQGVPPWRSSGRRRAACPSSSVGTQGRATAAPTPAR